MVFNPKGITIKKGKFYNFYRIQYPGLVSDIMFYKGGDNKGYISLISLLRCLGSSNTAPYTATRLKPSLRSSLYWLTAQGLKPYKRQNKNFHTGEVLVCDWETVVTKLPEIAQVCPTSIVAVVTNKEYITLVQEVCRYTHQKVCIENCLVQDDSDEPVEHPTPVVSPTSCIYYTLPYPTQSTDTTTEIRGLTKDNRVYISVYSLIRVVTGAKKTDVKCLGIAELLKRILGDKIITMPTRARLRVVLDLMACVPDIVSSPFFTPEEIQSIHALADFIRKEFNLDADGNIPEAKKPEPVKSNTSEQEDEDLMKQLVDVEDKLGKIMNLLKEKGLLK